MVTIGLDSLIAGSNPTTDSTRHDAGTGPGDKPGGRIVPAENDVAGGTVGPGLGGAAPNGSGSAGFPSWATRPSNTAVPPAQLQWGAVISASAALRIACHASVQRVLLDPAGAVLDVGRERRTVTPAQYAALIARDGGCAFPGCTRPPAWCIAHHIRYWAHGGLTNIDNLVMLCGHHHRVIHHHGWAVRIGAHDRLPTFTPPRWVDPDQQPRRNVRAKARWPRHESISGEPPDP